MTLGRARHLWPHFLIPTSLCSFKRKHKNSRAQAQHSTQHTHSHTFPNTGIVSSRSKATSQPRSLQEPARGWACRVMASACCGMEPDPASSC